MLRVLIVFFVTSLALGRGAAAQPLSANESAALFDQGRPALQQAFYEAPAGVRRVTVGLLLLDLEGNESDAAARQRVAQSLPSSDEIERDFGPELAAYARSLECSHRIRSGQIGEAPPLCRAATDALEAVENPLLRSRILMTESLLALRSGRLSDTVEPAQRALAAARESGSKFALAASLNAIAITQLFGGLHEDAIATYESMSRVTMGLESRSIAKIMQFNLGLAHMEAENFDQAVASFQSGLEWSQETGQSHRELIAKTQLARAHLGAGHADRAREILAEVIEGGGEGEDPDSYAHALLIWAEVQLAEGRTDAALRSVQEGLRLVEPAGNEMRRWQLQLAQAKVLRATGRAGEALAVAQEVADEQGAGEGTDELDDAHELVAEIAASLGLYEIAYRAERAHSELERDNRGRRYELGLALLEKNYSLTNAQRDLDVLRGEQEREEALAQRNTSLLAGLAAVLGLLAVTGSLNRSRREQHRIAAQQKLLTEELEGLVTVRTEALELEMLERMRGEEERRDLEKQLAEADKLRALGQLTGGIAHDFNNLLTVVTSASEMLADEPDMPDADRAELIAAIRRAADSGRDVNRGLLAYARQQPLEPEPIDIAELFESSRRLFERTLGDEMQLETDCDHATVLADRGKFTTALINLLVNARDASDGRGNVVVQARVLGSGLAEISVSDRGRGMSEDELDRAIEPFYSTKISTLASGLGLSMVYGFVRQSGGDLEIHSEPEEGTTVSLRLPLAESDTESGRTERNDARLPEQLRALLIDDNDDVREMVQRMLESLGISVEVAADGSSGLRAFERRMPDLLISDVLMPGELNGLELADKVRESAPSLPILLISGYANEVEINYPLLQKPFSLQDLERRLLELLGRQADELKTASA